MRLDTMRKALASLLISIFLAIIALSEHAFADDSYQESLTLLRNTFGVPAYLLSSTDQIPGARFGSSNGFIPLDSEASKRISASQPIGFRYPLQDEPSYDLPALGLGPEAISILKRENARILSLQKLFGTPRLYGMAIFTDHDSHGEIRIGQIVERIVGPHLGELTEQNKTSERQVGQFVARINRLLANGFDPGDLHGLNLLEDSFGRLTIVDGELDRGVSPGIRRANIGVTFDHLTKLRDRLTSVDTISKVDACLASLAALTASTYSP